MKHTIKPTPLKDIDSQPVHVSKQLDIFEDILRLTANNKDSASTSNRGVQLQLTMASSTTKEMDTTPRPKLTTKQKLENNICGNCGIKGHTIEICEGPLVDGFLDACPICNTNKHNLTTCPRPLSVVHAVRIQLYCRSRRPPIIMPVDPWEVDRQAFLTLWETGRLCLSAPLADKLWKEKGCPKGVTTVPEGNRPRDSVWSALKKVPTGHRFGLPNVWFVE